MSVCTSLTNFRYCDFSPLYYFFPIYDMFLREALQLSVRLKDTSLEAQACFSLGNTFILLRDPSTAVVFLLRHLIIARGLFDRIGEGRAHWSLANAYTALKRYDLALRCSKRHRRIARQVSLQLIICLLYALYDDELHFSYSTKMFN